MPATPARLTHGSLVKTSPPLASCGVFEHDWLVGLRFGRMREDVRRDLASSARRWGGRFARGDGGATEGRDGDDGGVTSATRLWAWNVSCVLQDLWCWL